VWVLSEIRSLPGQIEGLARALKSVSEALAALIELQRQNGPSDERLQKLELSRAQWEAELEAMLLKAESTYKAANASESRSRTMLRHAEKIADPFAEEGDEVEAPVPNGDAPRIPEDRLQPVPVGVAPSNKASAQRAKWMIS